MPFIQRPDYRLYYELTDDAAPWHEDPPAILFHHGIGADCKVWSEWIGPLADRYRLVRFDMGGFGRSDTPPSNHDWSMAKFAEDIIAVAAAVGASRFHFVGESIGGTIGLHFALAHADRLLSLTVSNGAHLGSSVERAKAWKDTIDSKGMEGWSRQFMEDRFFPGALTQQKWNWFHRQQASGNPRTTLDALSVLLGTNLQSELAALRLPVLLLHPDSSPFIPVSVMADMHARLPDSELRVFPHARHGLPFSHARECAATLRDFLDRRFVNESS